MVMGSVFVQNLLWPCTPQTGHMVVPTVRPNFGVAWAIPGHSQGGANDPWKNKLLKSRFWA